MQLRMPPRRRSEPRHQATRGTKFDCRRSIQSIAGRASGQAGLCPACPDRWDYEVAGGTTGRVYVVDGAGAAARAVAGGSTGRVNVSDGTGSGRTGLSVANATAEIPPTVTAAALPAMSTKVRIAVRI